MRKSEAKENLFYEIEHKAHHASDPKKSVYHPNKMFFVNTYGIFFYVGSCFCFPSAFLDIE